MKTKMFLMAMITCVIYGCSQEEVKIEEVPEVADGREIAKTVFFYTGDRAAEIPSFQPQIKKLGELLADDPVYIAEYEDGADKILDELAAKNPSYFDRLEEGIHSKNFNAISKAIQEGYNLIAATNRLNTLTSIEELSEQNILGNIDLDEYDFSKIEDLEKLEKLVEERFAEAGIDLEEAVASLSTAKKGGNDSSKQFCLALPGIALAYRVAANFIYVVNFNTQFNININQNFNLNQNFNIPRLETGSFTQERLVTEIAAAFEN